MDSGTDLPAAAAVGPLARCAPALHLLDSYSALAEEQVRCVESDVVKQDDDEHAYQPDDGARQDGSRDVVHGDTRRRDVVDVQEVKSKGGDTHRRVPTYW